MCITAAAGWQSDVLKLTGGKQLSAWGQAGRSFVVRSYQ